MDTYFSSVVSEGKRFVLKRVSERETRSRFRKEMGCGAACREHLDAGKRWSESIKNKLGPSKVEGRAFGRHEAGKESAKYDKTKYKNSSLGRAFLVPSPTPFQLLLHARALYRKRFPCL